MITFEVGENAAACRHCLFLSAAPGSSWVAANVSLAHFPRIGRPTLIGCFGSRSGQYVDTCVAAVVLNTEPIILLSGPETGCAVSRIVVLRHVKLLDQGIGAFGIRSLQGAEASSGNNTAKSINSRLSLGTRRGLTYQPSTWGGQLVTIFTQTARLKCKERSHMKCGEGQPCPDLAVPVGILDSK